MAERAYGGREVTVTFDGARCLHAAECVRGLPANAPYCDGRGDCTAWRGAPA